MECCLTRKWSFTRQQTNDLYENHRRVRLEIPGYTRWKLWWCVSELNQGLAKNLFALILYLPKASETHGHRHTHLLCCRYESVQVPIVLIQDLSGSGLSCRLQTNHNALGRGETRHMRRASHLNIATRKNMGLFYFPIQMHG